MPHVPNGAVLVFCKAQQAELADGSTVLLFYKCSSLPSQLRRDQPLQYAMLSMDDYQGSESLLQAPCFELHKRVTYNMAVLYYSWLLG